MPAPPVEEWITLLRSYALGTIPGDEFDSSYFVLFRRANDAHDAGEGWVTPAAAEAVLSDFYFEVDCLSNDPVMFPDLHVTDDELRPALRIADQLEALE